MYRIYDFLISFKEKVPEILKALPLFLLALLPLITGCAKYKVPTRCFIHEKVNRCKEEGDMKRKWLAVQHPLYQVIPRHRCQIRWYDLGHWTTWALFGNDNDGIFGEEPTARYLPELKPSRYKALRWWCRNPFHNFTFYVIGSADRPNAEIDILRVTPYRISSGHCRCPGKTNFPSKQCSCFYVALHGGKPFVSLRIIHSKKRKSDFYAGWRNRGNFGLKCVIFGKRKK